MTAKKTGWLGFQFSWRFEILLFALLAFLGATPFIHSWVVIGFLASVVLISSVAAVNEGRVFTRVAWAFALASLLTLWAAEITSRSGLVIASGFFDIGLYLVITGAILAYVFRATEVTREVLAAAICAYLLMGVCWSNVYVVMENLAPGSFSSGALAYDVPGGMTSIHDQQSFFVYFSLVTISTLGYGDITPVTPQARSLAALEAIIGQLFIGVLVARLVGQQIRPKKKTLR